MQSESIKEIASALSKVQGQLKPAVKTSENPFFKSTYADLAAVWEVCRKLLAENNLSVVQTGCFENGLPYLRTLLLHTSGEWIDGLYELKPTKQDPQGMGSAVTYARRYSLAAMIGIVTEDDDANEASKPAKTFTKTVKIREKQNLQSVKEKIELVQNVAILEGIEENLKTSKLYKEEEKKELYAAIEKRKQNLEEAEQIAGGL